jgi:hypothetical protein
LNVSTICLSGNCQSGWPSGSGWTVSGNYIYNSTTAGVGIGTSSPSSFKLQVAGNVGPDAGSTYNLGSIANRWNFIIANHFTTNDGTNNWDLSGTTDFIFAQNGIERVRFTGGGNIGIGTASPIQKLDVVGGTEAIYSRNSTGGAYTFIGYNDAGGYGRIGSYGGGTWKNLTIEEGGNVGIGTTNPPTKLTVSPEGLTDPNYGGAATYWMKKSDVRCET